MKKYKPKQDNQPKSTIPYDIVHEENPHNRILKDVKRFSFEFNLRKKKSKKK